MREAVGAGLPLAGVGCAIRRALIEQIAAARGGQPFDADSLTEDYELGLTIASMGAPMTMAEVVEAPDGLPVAVRAYFPDTFETAARQKARWMIGIALAGWDRTGWAGARRLGDHWMRARDRRAPIALAVLLAAYCALPLWTIGIVAHLLGGPAPPAVEGWLATVLGINGVLLAWRVAMRVHFTRRIYGWGEGAKAVPRLIVGNMVAMAAARRALTRYVAMLRGARVTWDKTAHHFPETSEIPT